LRTGDARRVWRASRLIRSSVHQPLATDAGEHVVPSLRVIDAERNAEIEFCQVSMKVRTAAMLSI